jgi:ATP-dependent RNA helicase SUPV3L1/SUV3
MGLNLDVGHVAFAGLSKFDGQRQRRLFPAEMAQIAGRAGRHQRDGTFGCLAGSGGQGAEFTPEEIYAIEEHRFAPLTKLFWRESSPRFDTVASLIGDLEAGPAAPTLASAPEAIDLAVLKLLSSEADIAATLRGHKQIQRFWQVCSLPDFRAQGVEHHARFVARLWQELAHGPLASDYAPRMIAQLDVTSGDIHALQGRIAAIRSWAYIAQRPDWLPAREEMTMRARNVEARLSDALHARLTERFVNRRTSVLMRKMGVDAGLLPVGVKDGVVRVDGEVIGQLDLFKLTIDPAARHEESKLLLAAAERHLPSILSQKASDLAREIAAGTADLRMEDGAISYGGAILVRLAAGRGVFAPQMMPDAAVLKIPPEAREMLLTAVAGWFERQIAKLAPLRRIDVASCALAAGPELRAVLIKLTDGGGILPRADSGVANLSQVQREALRHLQVKLGALDLFVPAMLRAGPLALWRQLRLVWRREMIAPVAPVMHPTLPQKAPIMLGYRRFGGQLLRIDMAEKLILAAHKGRKAGTRHFEIAPDLAISMGLATENYAVLLRLAGFRPIIPRKLPDNAFGPPAPLMWRWVPVRPQNNVGPIMVVKAGAFAALADLVV